MIAPLSQADIDIFIVLHPGYYRADGQTALLNSVRDALRVTYPKTPRISRNGQAVSINFTDFAVDVVPAFNAKAAAI
jgi:tRNA nucleotidyltransferase (CCA-adding enzyme)